MAELQEPEGTNSSQDTLSKAGTTRIILTEPPKFDLESYIANYEGPTRLARLKLIGTRSKPLSLDALKLGIAEASEGQDGSAYREFVSLYNSAAPQDTRLLDADSVASKIEMIARKEADRLENDLKGYKNNLIKESIRLGNDDLGQHYYNSGDLSEAFKAFSRMREYCTMPKHAAEMSLKLILTAIAQDQWMHVTTHIYKLQNLSLKPDDKLRIEPALHPLRGLVSMASGSYRDAATAFLQTDSTYGAVEGVAGVKPSTQILTPNDVAVYGGLCALTSMSRQELLTSVLENADFRSFLELESHLRRAIVCFCNAKYTQCLEILEAYRTDYMLDIFLERHVAPLYAGIRRKSIVAYCAPFSRVSITEMGTAFGVDGQTMENELYDMITRGDLDARLDVVDMVLVANNEDKRAAVHEKALAMAQEHEHALRLRLFRLNMLQAGHEIKGPKKDAGEASSKPRK